MAGDDEIQRYDDFEDTGAERTPEAGETPGNGRGPALLLVAILAFLSLAWPIAWGAGLLIGLRDVLGLGAMTVLWAVWAVVVVILMWVLAAMWRRAA